MGKLGGDGLRRQPFLVGKENVPGKVMGWHSTANALEPLALHFKWVHCTICALHLDKAVLKNAENKANRQTHRTRWVSKTASQQSLMGSP